MRALLGVLLLASAGCDVLWGSYTGVADLSVADASVPFTMCPDGMSCDLAGTSPPDMAMPLSGCNQTNLPCTGGLVCDINTGLCVAGPVDPRAFIPNSTPISLNGQYDLLATGDFNGDGVMDAAVSGRFSGGVNATGAAQISVLIYLGDGNGGLNVDTFTPIPITDRVVSLLAIPGPGMQTDLLVATFGTTIYHCTRGKTVWTAPPLTILSLLSNTFKKLGLSNDDGQATNGPDLLVTETKNLFQDNNGSSGLLEVHRNSGNYTYPITPSEASNSNVSGAAAVRFASVVGDIVATTWDTAGVNAGTPFYYFKLSDDSFNRMGNSALTAAADYTALGLAKPYMELAGSPLASIVPVKVNGQTNPTLLFTYSQNPNSLSILTGATPATFTLKPGTPVQLSQAGLMLPYAGDADNDGTDELGVYTMAVNATAITSHITFYSYKNAVLNTTTPIVDLMLPNNNVRGIGLGYLGNSMDRRKQSNRRDLVALIEDQAGMSSLLIARANLNYTYP